MPNSQESLYQVSLIVKVVANDLSDVVVGTTDLTDFEIVDLVGRLDFACDLIRKVNGACD